MKRDMDLIRKIVLMLDSDEVDGPIESLEGVSDKSFKYHARLLYEAGYVQGRPFGDLQIGLHFYIDRLTWEGHELASVMADQSIWNKAREVILKPGVAWTIAILADWLKQQAMLKLPNL